MPRRTVDARARLRGKKYTVQHQLRRCSCQRCKEGGSGHGYFYYAYYYKDGRMWGVYLGKELPAWIEDKSKEKVK